MYKILIVKFGALGDVIRTSYILKGLYEKYNEPKICWLTSSLPADLLRYNPYIFQIVTPEMDLVHLQRIPFDLLVSMDDEIEVLSNIGLLHYERIIGAFLKNGNPDYSAESAEWFDMGLISRYGKEYADELKKKNTKEHNEIMEAILDVKIKEPEFYNSPLLEKSIAKRFNGNTFNIGLNSGAGSRWISKQLPINETVTLVSKLLSMEIQGKKTAVYLLGGKEEEERHRLIKNAIASERLIDAGSNNSLLEFAAIIKRCDYIITSDSLALHLAVSQKVRNLSFFAPTSAAEIGTFGSGVKVLSLSHDYCSYRKDADNSSITADRIMQTFCEHLGI